MNELHGLARVAAAIKAQIGGNQTQAGLKVNHHPPTPKAATPSQLAQFEPELRRVLDKAPRAEQASLERIWRKSFDNDPSNTLAMLCGVK